MKLEITPEIVKALAVLRDRTYGGADGALMSAINILDNAGVFSAIDEATGYDVDPAPEKVSKCTCSHATGMDGSTPHNPGCPGDPAEWGDLAYTTATALENERLTAEHHAKDTAYTSKVPGWSQAVEATRKTYEARGWLQPQTLAQRISDIH